MQIEKRARDSDFRDFYQRERNNVITALRRCGLPRAELDDAAQEVFIVFFRKFSAESSAAGASALLRAIAARVAANQRRKLARAARRAQATGCEQDFEGVAYWAAPRPDEAAATREARQLVTRALSNVERVKREVVRLAEFEELTMLEIAQRTRACSNTVASRLRLGRATLARSLKRSLCCADPRSLSVPFTP